MADHNFASLKAEIISRSNATTWEHARREWELQEIYFADDPETCLCTHHPIIELCILRNRVNGNEATVGNVCVHRFLELESEPLFRSFKRVAKDPSKSLSAEAVAYLLRRGLVSQWEHDFIVSTHRKRKLSVKQKNKRREINERVQARLRRTS